jgi:hypothetical protein
MNLHGKENILRTKLYKTIILNISKTGLHLITGSKIKYLPKPIEIRSGGKGVNE